LAVTTAAAAAATASTQPASYPSAAHSAGANLTAVITPGGQTNCTKAPSPKLNQNGVTVTNPGPGLCNNDGSMPPGTYNLDQTAPPGTVFDRWDCYDNVAGGQPDEDVDSVTLQAIDVFTCVAIYNLKPKLALISEFPASYNGTSEYSCISGAVCRTFC
jgi:hypothetical protein